MAKPTSTTGEITQWLSTALLLICIGLAFAHVVSSIRTQPSSGESVIQRTFTTDKHVASNRPSNSSIDAED